MKAPFAVLAAAAGLVAALILSTGCPKTGTTTVAPNTKPDVAPADAGVPVATNTDKPKKDLPEYKPKHTRPKVRLYRSSGVPWFRGRLKRPNLAKLPSKDVTLPPANLTAEIAALAALKRANPKKADYYRLKAVLAYRAYERAARAKKSRKKLDETAKTMKNWRARYRLQKRIRALKVTIRTNLAAAAAKYKELASSAEAKKRYAELPRALYQYGLVLAHQRQWLSALKWWEDVAKQSPTTAAAGAAHHALAQFHFRKGSFGRARKHYELAAATPIKIKRDYWRQLRSAWTLVRTRDAKRGFEALLKLPRSPYIRGWARDEAKLLVSTVFQVAPWAYAGYGKAEGAVAAMRKLNYRAPWRLMRDLAAVYAWSRQRRDAIGVYKLLLAKLPKDQDVCLWRFYSVAQQLAGKPTPKAIQALENVIVMYKKASAARLLPSEGQRKCENAVKAISMRFARRLHREARRAPASGTWAAAEKLYKLHLDTFSPATRVRSDYTEMHWRQAELEKDAKVAFKMWQETAQQFVLLSHRNAWRRLQDKAKRAAAMAFSNAAAIAEVGYIDGVGAKDAEVLYAKSCSLGRSSGFKTDCDRDKKKPVGTTKPATPMTPTKPTTPKPPAKPATPPKANK